MKFFIKINNEIRDRNDNKEGFFCPCSMHIYSQTPRGKKYLILNLFSFLPSVRNDWPIIIKKIKYLFVVFK